LVYSDICETITTHSLGGDKYFITFIDDFSCLFWTYAIQSNDKSLENLNGFKSLVENNSNHRIKSIMIGHGDIHFGNGRH